MHLPSPLHTLKARKACDDSTRRSAERFFRGMAGPVAHVGGFWRRVRYEAGFLKALNVTLAAVLLLVAALYYVLGHKRHVLRCAAWAYQTLFRCGDRSRAAAWPMRLAASMLRHACMGTAGSQAALFPPPSQVLRRDQLRALVLKAPRLHPGGTLERGVFILENNYWIDSFRHVADVRACMARYTIVLEPSCSGLAIPAVLAWTAYAPECVVVMAGAAADRRLLTGLGSNLVPVAIGTDAWADATVFRPLGRPHRRYGAVAVARAHVEKRLLLLFRAIALLSDPDFRLALILGGRPSPERHLVAQWIRWYHLDRQVDVLEGLSPEQMNACYNDAKVNVLLSRQEGGSRAVTEGLLAGTPALLTAEHVSTITRDRVVPSTGLTVEDRDLPEALAYFRDHWMHFSPRAWALTQVTPEVSIQRLERLLQELAHQRGEPWTSGLHPKCNTPTAQWYPRGAAPPELLTLRPGMDCANGTWTH